MNTTTGDSTTRGTTTPSARAVRNRRVGGVFAGLAVATIGLAAATAAVSPASAQVLDSDRPKVTESHFDFGKNWTLGAPRNGGYLDWDEVDGVTTPRLSGYLYLTDKECGRVRVQYYDNDSGEHDLLATKYSSTHCAPGNGKTQWWIEIDSYSSSLVDHVHVDLQRESSSGSFSVVGGDTESFD
jgi:hypothetical protein